MAKKALIKAILKMAVFRELKLYVDGLEKVAFSLPFKRSKRSIYKNGRVHSRGRRDFVVITKYL